MTHRLALCSPCESGAFEGLSKVLSFDSDLLSHVSPRRDLPILRPDGSETGSEGSYSDLDRW